MKGVPSDDCRFYRRLKQLGKDLHCSGVSWMACMIGPSIDPVIGKQCTGPRSNAGTPRATLLKQSFMRQSSSSQKALPSQGYRGINCDSAYRMAEAARLHCQDCQGLPNLCPDWHEESAPLSFLPVIDCSRKSSRRRFLPKVSGI